MGRKKSVDKTIDLEAEVLKATQKAKAAPDPSRSPRFPSRLSPRGEAGGRSEAEVKAEKPKAKGVVAAPPQEASPEASLAETNLATRRPTVKVKAHKKRGEKVRSHRYQESLKNFDATKTYPLREAIILCQKNSLSKFDGSLELHLRLGVDPKDESQKVKSSLILPFGTGKKIKIMAFVGPDKAEACRSVGADFIGSEKTIDEILAKERALNFDRVVATPDFMPRLARVAKILGPKGLMPSPKNATVTIEPEKAILDLKKGRLEIKMDPTTPVVHLALGKLSFRPENLEENFRAVLAAVKEARPAKAKGEYLVSAHLSPTMGPSVKVLLS